MDEDWPISEARCAEIFQIKPRTLRKHLNDIRNALPDAICYQPVGRGKIFFEDNFETLRECLTWLSRSKNAAGGSRTSGRGATPFEVLLPGEATERALRAARKLMEQPRSRAPRVRTSKKRKH